MYILSEARETTDPKSAMDIAMEEARAHAYSMPIEDINVADGFLFKNNTMWPYFERLRKEDPVHLTTSKEHGKFWSVTKYNDIMKVDTSHNLFSSADGITVATNTGEFKLPMFIAMDQPKHDVQRKTVAPMVAPNNLKEMEALIRERTQEVLDSLPIDEEFDWVDTVSIELTTRMLATLFDFPLEQRRKLTRWSDAATATKESGVIDFDPEVEGSFEAAKQAELRECLAAFMELWNERVNAEPKGDLISMLAHGEDTRNMDPLEYLGNLVLLIVGGNDTTRNSMTGGLLALNENPDQYAKLNAHPELIPSMVSEIIRWQTPLAHMRRIANEDTELGGKQIKKGDKVVMWYVSGNRDEEVIKDADDFIIDRERPRQHMSFGYGIHRCVGNRLAEMQLQILWEEIALRFEKIEVLEEPTRIHSAFVKGYERMMVKIPARK
jgi:cytochrome P450